MISVKTNDECAFQLAQLLVAWEKSYTYKYNDDKYNSDNFFEVDMIKDEFLTLIKEETMYSIVDEMSHLILQENNGLTVSNQEE